MQKVLITGCAGFIFSHVTDYLLEEGYEVVGLDNLSQGSHPELIPIWEELGMTFHKIDVADKEVIDLIINEDPDYIIHAAAYSDVDGSIKNAHDIIQKNCDATINVFEAARQIPDLKKLVYISTDEIYGECTHRKAEGEILFPKNPYSFSKACGSLLRLAYDNTYPELKDKTAETRFCNVIGERQDDRKILPRIKRALETGDPVPVHNGGTGYREYIWVDNIPPAVEQIMLNGDRVYNITNNDGFTVNELIDTVEYITNKKVPVAVGDRPGMDEKYQMCSFRIKDELGWTPTVLFAEGLHKYLC